MTQIAIGKMEVMGLDIGSMRRYYNCDFQNF